MRLGNPSKKILCSALFLSILMLCFENLFALQQAFPDLYGPYFGQQEPGANVAVFADGIISGNPLHGTPVFSTDMNEMYWPQALPDFSNVNIYVSKKINNQWTAPEITSFSGDYMDDNPVFSPDGQKIFFNSFRPHNGTSKERIWYVVRQGDGSWSDAVSVGDEINENELHWQVGVDPDGCIYFQTEREPSYGGGDIFFSEFINGQFQTPINLGPIINSSTYDSMPFIDRQNRFMLFCRSGFFISERIYGGSWTQPRSITSDHPNINGICPQITPDGNYLFFTIMNNETSTVYWTSAQFIYNSLTDLDDDPNNELPNEFQLNQNYPNPFNPSTTIEYAIPSESNVTIKIYDIIGNEVAALVDDILPAGNYSITFDASGLASGIYLYHMEALNGIALTKKLVVQK